MTAFSKEQLKLLVKARKRPTSFKLGDIPDTLIHRLIEYYHQHNHENILDKTIERRTSRNVPVEDSSYLNENYGQIALQALKSGGVPANRLDYSKPLAPDLIEKIQEIIGPGYRMRLSALNIGAQIPEHVDDPEQIRALALLKGRQMFSLRTKSDQIELEMKLGEIWYINTAWPHKVVNLGKQTRLALMIDLADYDFEKKITEILI